MVAGGLHFVGDRDVGAGKGLALEGGIGAAGEDRGDHEGLGDTLAIVVHTGRLEGKQR